MFRRKRVPIQFSGKKRSVKGMVVTILGLVALVALIALPILSSESGGNGGLVIGILGLLVMTLSIIGLVVAVMSFKEKDIFYKLPIAGLVINGILFLICFIIYIVGMSS